MRKFITKTVFFLLLAVIFIESVSAIILVTKLYLIDHPGKEIYVSIEKSKKKSKSKILLLGDSVGYQIFKNKSNNDEINSLACNQAIGIVGQFFLLNNYLKAGNEIDKLIMFFHPSSFMNNLDQKYTYHYFLKPFDNSEYDSMFTKTVHEQINKIPYRYLINVPHIKITSWAPEFNTKDTKKYTFLSPISKEYLSKIKTLSIKFNFELIILPTPTSFEKKTLIEYMNKDEIAESSLNKELMDYFNNIVYLNKTEFISDGVHLTQPEKYTDTYKRIILE